MKTKFVNHQNNRPTFTVLLPYALTVIFCLLLPTNNIFAQPVTLDPTFGENGIVKIPFDSDDYLFDFDKSGNIVAVGIRHHCPYSCITIVKTNADGIIYENFGNKGIVQLEAIDALSSFKITNTNKIFIYGSCMTNDGRKHIFIQLNENGSFDETYGENGIITLNSIGNQHDLLNFETDDYLLFGKSYNNALYKYNYNGEIDLNFGENGVLYLVDNGIVKIIPKRIKILKDQSILVAGYTYNVQDPYVGMLALCKLTSDGKYDTNFANNGIWTKNIIESDYYTDYHTVEYFSDVIENPNGHLIVLGSVDIDFGVVGAPSTNLELPIYVCSFNHDGYFNNDFGTDGFFYYSYSNRWPAVQKMIPYKNNYLIQFQGNKIISVNSNGTYDATFNTTGMIYFEGFRLGNMTLQGEKKLVFSGSRSTENEPLLVRIILPSDVSIKPYYGYDNPITVFPTPTTGELQIISYELRIINVEVFDIYGRNKKAESRMQNEIDISGLSAGIYFVKITTEQGEVVKKVVKH